MREENPAYAYVMSAILRGAMQPGEKLSEPHLAAELGISRAPVREALRRLQSQGLLVHIANQGMRVIKPTRAEQLALFDVRENLETMSCALAAKHMSDADLAALGRLMTDHAAQVAASESGAYLQTDSDSDFHIRLARGSGNPVLTELLCDQLYPRLKLCRLLHKAVPGRGARAWEEHQRIYEALLARDSDWAGLMMRRHIQNAKASLLALG